MHEEPIDRYSDLWIERKRRFDLEEAARRGELIDNRYRSAHEGPSRYSPPHPADPRYSQLPNSAQLATAPRNASSPRSQLPPSHPHFAPEEDAVMMREDPAVSVLKRRRLGDGLDRDDRRRDEPLSGGRSPPSYRRTDSGQRYLDEREAYADDQRSPAHPPYANRSNGRMSPLDRPLRSPASGGPPLPPMQDGHRPSVLSASSYDDGPDHGPGMLARRRGDAAQAKASRLHIDTGSSASFDATSLSRSSTGIAKSAPPQKLSFDARDHAMAQDHAQREAELRSGHPSLQPAQPSAAMRTDQQQRLVSGSRLPDTNGAFRRDEREELLGLREGRMPDMPHTANPLARQGPATRMGGHVPQTATLPSPAYHTTQFARGHPSGRQAYNPPPTARLPDHLRSPPSSKQHFLSLFADFYDSLHDSRTLKATLEDQIKRSNTLLQTLQSSRRVLEETVDRRVREERVLWEGRVRGLEARVRELEAKTGTGDYNDETMSRAAEPAAKVQSSINVAPIASTEGMERREESSTKPASRERSPTVNKPEPSSSNKDEDEGDQLQDD